MGKRKNLTNDIRPAEIYMTSRQYAAIKKQHPNISFEIKDKRIAKQLLDYSFIREEYIIVPEEYRLNDKVLSQYVRKSTGKYLLTIKGEYYLDYRKQYNVNYFKNEFRAWITLIIAIAGFALSVYSIYLSQLTNVK